MLIDYVAAGFDPAQFWTITPRMYDLHMQGAVRRIERDIEISNRLAYNTAALTGGAMAGKLETFDKIFGRKIRAVAPQSAEILEANLRALAVAWGADLNGLSA